MTKQEPANSNLGPKGPSREIELDMARNFQFQCSTPDIHSSNKVAMPKPSYAPPSYED